MKIIICEDDRLWDKRIKYLTEKWTNKKNVIVRFISLSVPQEVTNYLAKYNDVDLVFLDISLGEKVDDGIALAKTIRRMGNEVPIIFVTNFIQRATDGYLVDAVGFLEKPINEKRLVHFLDKIWDKQKHEKTIRIAVDKFLVTIKLKNIVYIEVIDHDIFYHTTTGDFKTRGTLKDVLKVMHKDYFVQIHRSYIISLEKIIGVKTSYPYAVKLQSNNVEIMLTVSRKFFSSLMKAYTDDLLEKTV